MEPILKTTDAKLQRRSKKRYISVAAKFAISHCVAWIWVWQQPEIFTKYLTGVNLMMPYLDFTYTFCWLPGLILALFGHYWIVGPMTLLVLPLTLISNAILYSFQKKYVFNILNLRVRKNRMGFILFVLFYQVIMSPISCYGYVEEIFKLKRKWK